MLNDNGGGIFRLIDGPNRMPFFEEFSVTSNTVSLQHLTKAYGINFQIATDYNELRAGLKLIFSKNNAPALLEVATGKSENSSIFKEFNKKIQY